MIAADAVVFAIRAGLQLYGAVRKAYVDATRGRDLVLPLPDAPGRDWTSAKVFFSDAANAQRYPEGAALAGQVTNASPQENKDRLTALHTEALSAERAVQQGVLSGDDIAAVMTVRQWARGKFGPEPTGLQTVAGTLVNIAIDYFLERPGAISDKSPQGRALRGFLDSLDDTDFATVAVTEIAPDLMIAVLESVAANPDLFGGGANERLLVENITKTLATSAKDLLADATSTERRDASAWLQLVARSVLKGGAETILANPQRFLGADDDVAPLIQSVGGAIAGIVIGERAVDFRPLLSAAGLEKVTKAALGAVAANPGILGKDPGLQKIFGGVAGAVAGMNKVFTKDIFPEVVRLVLDKTADNLDLVWQGAAQNASPAKHLLLTATKTFLKQFARKPEGTWKPVFTGDQIVGTLDAVLDEVVDNPDWLVKRAGKSDVVLGEVVAAVLGSLRKVDGTRLSADAGVAVLRAGVEAVALQIRFLDDLTPEGETAARAAISAALDAIFDEVFGAGSESAGHWKLARNSAIVALVEVSMEELAQTGLEKTHIAVLRKAVQDELEDPAPFDADDFAEDLRVRLAAA